MAWQLLFRSAVAATTGLIASAIRCRIASYRGAVISFGVVAALLISLAGQSIFTQVLVGTIDVGDSPAGLAVNSVTDRIYVANEEDGSVSVIDGALNTVIDTIPVGFKPRYVAVNSNTNRIYVTHYFGHNVMVIDGATNSVITSVPLGPTNPMGIAVNPVTNRIYVAGIADGTQGGSVRGVFVIDGDSNSVITTVQAGDFPEAVAVNPTTNVVYVTSLASPAAPTLFAIDGATNSVVDSVSVGNSPSCLAVNPQTNQVYVSNQADMTVSVVDGASHSVSAIVGVGGHAAGIAVDVVNNRVYVVGDSNTPPDVLRVIDGTNNDVVASMYLPAVAGSSGAVCGLGVNPATRRVYVAHQQARAVSVVDDPQSESQLVVLPVNGTFGGTVNMSATLTSAGSPLVGRTVNFILSAIPVGSGVTDANGVAVVTGVSIAGHNPGTYPGGVGAYFEGDSSYRSRIAQAHLVVSANPPPTVTIVAPAEGAIFSLNQVVVASYSCSDDSGVASCAGPVTNGNPIDTATLGPHTFTVSATDVLGAATTATRHYSVVSVPASYITVNTTADELNTDGDCSLREAVQAANTHAAVDACPAVSGAGVIVVPAGTYVLSIPGSNEDANLTADLDVLADVTIVGAGAASTIIDGSDLDRGVDIATGVAVRIYGLTIKNGSSFPYRGGGIRNMGTATLTSVIVTENTAGGSGGGGIANDGRLSLRDSTVSANFATSGGGIESGGTLLALQNSVISGNTSGGGGGGGIAFFGATLVIANSAITSNSTGGSGGGFYAFGSAFVSGSVVSNNIAPFVGGGILNQGTMYLTNSTISANASGAGQGAGGGGIYNNATLTVDSSTIYANTAAIVGGGILNQSIASLRNTIVAGNTAANCSGAITSAGHNLDSDGTCGLTSPGDISNIDPLLGPLADNGGPTHTHALLAGSPAIDAGSIICPSPATDQRGVARPQGASCDIGAYEVGNLPTPPTLLSGAGIATIDGVLSAGEWDSADYVDLTVNLPGGGLTPARLLVMNDAGNLYLALRIERVGLVGSSLAFEFDNNDDGVRENGDDLLVTNQDGAVFDDFRTNVSPPCQAGSPPAACGPLDADFGGTNDGASAFQSDGVFSVYELSKPLNSGDAGHDFSLSPGDAVGFFLDLRIQEPPFVYPLDFGETSWPGLASYARIQLADVEQPVITWSNPADIVYGTALSGAQLNATASVPGSFVYSPPPGTTLDAGNGQPLSVTFIPTDAAHYATVTESVSINVLKATPSIVWNNPANIVVGVPLGPAQLNAMVNAPGNLVYSPPPGTVLSVGNAQTLSVTFTPLNGSNYTGASASVAINVVPPPTRRLIIEQPTFSSFQPIRGSGLLPNTLCQLSLGGTLVGFVPIGPSGTSASNFILTGVPEVFPRSTTLDCGFIQFTGMQSSSTASVQMSPFGSLTFDPPTVLANVNIRGEGLPASCQFLLSSFSGILGSGSVGTGFGGAVTTADGTFNTFFTTLAEGLDRPEFQWNGLSVSGCGGFVLTGPNPGGPYPRVVDLKRVPIVTWFPQPILVGTPLGDAQLNATADIAGTFVYTPPAGTVLPLGYSERLSVTFTPFDSSYTTTTRTASINIVSSVVSWNNPPSILAGTPLSGHQLNATANVPGTFVYTPPAGTVLPAGNGQALSVLFTPNDTASYPTVTKTVAINVVTTGGQIRGGVIDALTGTPLIGATVTAHDANGNAVMSTATDAAGEYVTSSLAPGVYYTKAGAGPGYGDEVYREIACVTGCDIRSGSPITVTTGFTYTGIDFTLTPGAIAGTVIDPAGAPMAGVTISLFGTDGSPVQTGSTGPDGRYAIKPLVAGNYLAKATNPTGQLDVLYNQLACAVGCDVTTGTRISVSTGLVTTADFRLPDATEPRVRPAISWGKPAAIPQGTALTGVQLNATAYVPGTFTYTPLPGTVLPAGAGQTLSATFTPTDTATYTTATATVTIDVGASTMAWSTPADIVFGTRLGPAQLNATSNLPGTFVYNPPANTLLAVGSRVLSVTFTPDDSAHYPIVSANVTINVLPALTLSWNAPAAIAAGTPLGATQLNATASVPGTFFYTPPAGTVLPAGNGQVLTVWFVPTDARYQPATRAVTINVAASGGQFRGAVTNAVTGTPVAGATVTAHNLSGAAIASVMTDAAGHFVTPPLATGSYLAKATAGPGFVDEVYREISCLTGCNVVSGTRITVPLNIVVSGIDFTLTPLSAIAGTVTSPAGAPMANVTVSVFGTDASLVKSELTGPDGRYAVTGLPAAEYFARATNPTGQSDVLFDQLACAVGCDVRAGTKISTQIGLVRTADFRLPDATEPRITPTIKWAKPSPIPLGTPLGAAQLNATAYVPGTFAYNPPPGTLLPAGAGQTLSVTFTPDDQTTYTTATASTTIDISATTLTWNAPADILVGTRLSGVQLNATANVLGTPVYNPPAGTLLAAGNRTLSVTFTPFDPSFPVATATVTIKVLAPPTFSWPQPAPIMVGTPLTAAQLNATASVAGNFIYSPPLGTVLPVGNAQILTAYFMPANTTLFSPVYRSVAINVVTTGGQFRGAVIDAATGSPIGNASVTAHDFRGNAVASMTTDAAGQYLTPPLAVGAYYATAAAGPSYVDEVYRELACISGCSVVSGTPITVPVNVVVPNVDFTLNPLAVIAGTVTDSAGAPMANVTVSVFGTDATLVKTGSTGSNGKYAVTGLPTGQFFARAANPTGQRDVLYDQLACVAGCDVTLGTKISATIGLVATADFRMPDATEPRVRPTIKWAKPAPIPRGVALGSTQLNAVAYVPGTFVYTPPAGTVLPDGAAQTLSVTFTPDDTATYTSATATVTVDVGTSVLTWSTPADVAPGTRLSSIQLNATANVPGTFVYTPPPGTLLSTPGNQTLSVIFTPTDSAGFPVAMASVSIKVLTIPIVSWSSPAAIAAGMPLSSVQLNASANAPGSFAYTPPAGTALTAGNGQVLSVIFTPSDPAQYVSVTRTVLLNVLATSGGFSGAVTDSVSGIPVAGATVTAHALNGVAIATVTTDAAGQYATPPLATALYYAKATAPGHLDEVYRELTCLSGCAVTSGSRISVPVNVVVPGINFTLTAQAAITGRVTDADSNPIADVTVSLFDASGTPVKTVSSNATGHYAATGVPTGSYFAHTTNSAGFTDVLFDGISCAVGCDVTTGTPISTSIGLVATANFQLPDNTQPGTNVVVRPRDPASGTRPVTVTFTEVWTAGRTTIAVSNTGPPLPPDYALSVPPFYFNLNTTATYGPSISVCASFAGLTFADPTRIRLLHDTGSGWVDGTTTLNHLAQVVCAAATTLSTFVVAESTFVPDTTAPIVSFTAPSTDAMPTGGALEVQLDASDLVGVTNVTVNTVVATRSSGTPQAGTWRASVPISLPVAPGGVLQFNATALDSAANAGTSTLLVDTDGIPKAMDRDRSSGLDQSAFYSNDFKDGPTAGTLARNGWTTQLSVAPAAGGVRATVSGAGSVAVVSACIGLPKEVRLDAATETADILCDPVTGRITVRAVRAVAQIQLRAQLASGAWQQFSLKTAQAMSIGSPAAASADNTEPIDVQILQVDPAGEEIVVGTYQLNPGARVDVSVVAAAPGGDGGVLVEALQGSVTVTVGGTTRTLGEGESGTLPIVVVPKLPGHMNGKGEVTAAGVEHHFLFKAASRHGAQSGELKYWFEQKAGARKGSGQQQFDSVLVSSVTFTDELVVRPGQPNGPLADTVVFSGTGRWNGLGGYTFEARAVDAGEPGRRRDRMSITVRDRKGAIVAAFDGTLDGGNIQSTRASPD